MTDYSEYVPGDESSVAEGLDAESSKATEQDATGASDGELTEARKTIDDLKRQVDTYRKLAVDQPAGMAQEAAQDTTGVNLSVEYTQKIMDALSTKDPEKFAAVLGEILGSTQSDVKRTKEEIDTRESFKEKAKKLRSAFDERHKDFSTVDDFDMTWAVEGAKRERPDFMSLDMVERMDIVAGILKKRGFGNVAASATRQEQTTEFPLKPAGRESLKKSDEDISDEEFVQDVMAMFK